MKKSYNRNELLKRPSSESAAIELQLKWAEYIRNEDAPKISLDEIKKVSGADLTYIQHEEEEYGIACAVLWDTSENKELDHSFAIDKVEFPYISGLLAFREIPLASQAIEKLTQKPDLIMFDGHGRAHPRRFGAATAIGVAMNVPSVGIAKRPLVGGWEWKSMQKIAGNKLAVSSKNEIVEYVIVLQNGFSPVFVSVGYKITIETCIEICIRTVRYHKQPECLGKAHNYLQIEKNHLLNDFISESGKS